MEGIRLIIQALKISDKEKEKLSDAVESMLKTLVILDFKFRRTLTDKAAITNILNASLEEIEDQKTIIENTRDELNRNLNKLNEQNVLIENKNVVLNQLLADLKEAQSQLVQSEKMASLGQLTAGVAHEINNPINFVSANIKPLKDDISEILECIDRYENVIKANKLETVFSQVHKLNKKSDINLLIREVQDLLRGMDEGARRTSEIVKGLRNFSRLDQNIAKYVDLNEGIKSTLTLLHSTYNDDIEIITDFGDIPKVECFPGQINQVFMNVLSNAIQSIDATGQVVIKTWYEDKEVKILIRDTGKGMSDEVKKKIFEPFFTTKKVGDGTGLGLSISFGIIEQHQGKIEVESVHGKGTEFLIILPLEQKKVLDNEFKG